MSQREAEAFNAAKSAIRSLPRPIAKHFKPMVWWNLDWHWKIKSDQLGVAIMPASRGGYVVYVSDEPGSAGTHSSLYGDDLPFGHMPYAAYCAAVRQVKEIAKARRKRFKELNKVLKKVKADDEL